MISRCEMIWNEAPEFKTQSSSGLYIARSQNDQCTDLIIKINSTNDNWFVIVLNSFRCCSIDVFFAIFRLNSFFIKYTLLFAKGFSYILEKAFIRSVVVFSFTTLCATNLDRVNLITSSTCLPRRAHSSTFIVRFFP